MSIFTGFAIYTTILLISIVLIKYKYKTYITPISHYAFYCFVASVLAPIFFYNTGITQASDESYYKTIFLNSIYWIGLVLAYLSNLNPFSPLGAKLHKWIRIPSSIKSKKILLPTFLLFQFFISFLLLVFFSGAGLLWLMSPREAYEGFRAGVGVFWSLSGASLAYLFLSVYCKYSKSIYILFIIFSLSCGFSYFLGSKALILSYALFWIYLYDGWVKPISLGKVLTISFGLLTFAMFMILAQSNGKNLLYSVRYFDYFENTANFLDNPASSIRHHGSVLLSNFWSYIPRGIYGAKPYVYGQMMVTDITFPGSAERGATPGILQWISIYWDFGTIGVFIQALSLGFISKSFYLLWREKKDLESSLLFFQFGFIYYVELFLFAPALVFLLWLFSTKLILKIVALEAT